MCVCVCVCVCVCTCIVYIKNCLKNENCKVFRANTQPCSPKRKKLAVKISSH